ncbi:MAG: hypothetical protein CMO81_03895 [Waddliaceae bacterium]|nr:hypothetical protein [Waddliaceae bacterium]
MNPILKEYQELVGLTRLLLREDSSNSSHLFTNSEYHKYFQELYRNSPKSTPKPKNPSLPQEPVPLQTKVPSPNPVPKEKAQPKPLKRHSQVQKPIAKAHSQKPLLEKKSKEEFELLPLTQETRSSTEEMRKQMQSLFPQLKLRSDHSSTQNEISNTKKQANILLICDSNALPCQTLVRNLFRAIQQELGPAAIISPAQIHEAIKEYKPQYMLVPKTLDFSRTQENQHIGIISIESWQSLLGNADAKRSLWTDIHNAWKQIHESK